MPLQPPLNSKDHLSSPPSSLYIKDRTTSSIKQVSGTSQRAGVGADQLRTYHRLTSTRASGYGSRKNIDTASGAQPPAITVTLHSPGQSAERLAQKASGMPENAEGWHSVRTHALNLITVAVAGWCAEPRNVVFSTKTPKEQNSVGWFPAWSKRARWETTGKQGGRLTAILRGREETKIRIGGVSSCTLFPGIEGMAPTGRDVEGEEKQRSEKTSERATSAPPPQHGRVPLSWPLA